MSSRRDAVRYGLLAATGVILLAAAGVASNAFVNGWRLLPGLILAGLVIGAAILVFITEVRSHLVASGRPPGIASAEATQPVACGPSNMLPRDLADFTGRQRELAVIFDEIRAPPTTGQQVQVLALHGMGGIGKTALAIHIAHRVADRFPDAMLYVDLRAHTDGQLPLEPGAALEVLMTSLGVPGNKIPATTDARAAQWRSLLAQRKSLIVIDNALGPDQVEPLLPGGGSSLVLITSRERLVSLPDVRNFSIKALSDEDSVEFFERIASSAIASASAYDIRKLVKLLGCIPLAIRLAAGRLLSHPAWNIPDLIEELESTDSSPVPGGINAALYRIFDLSYRGLEDPKKRFFCYLALSPAPNLTIEASAALANLGRDETGRLLDDLYYRNLLEEVQHACYRFHDLVKQYGIALAQNELSSREQGEARQRLLDFYLASAEAADSALRPLRRPPTSFVARVPYHDEFDGFSDALGWFDQEFPNLLACARACIDDQITPHAWRIMTALGFVLRMRDAYSSGLVLLNDAAELADRTGDLLGTADICREIGVCEARMTHYRPARLNAKRALSIYLKMGDLYGQASAHRDLSHLEIHARRQAQAREHALQALAIYSKMDSSHGICYAHTDLGILDLLDGSYETSRSHLDEALRISVRLGDRFGQFRAHLALGAALLHMREINIAQSHLEQARKISGSLRNYLGQASSYMWLGLAQAIAGNNGEAEQMWAKALRLYREIDHSAAGTVQQYIARLRLQGGTAFSVADLYLGEILW
jgi:tetratricopeptide (TPR) repeat protein